MNKRIVKALRNNNEFKADWYISQRLQRMTTYYHKEVGVEIQNNLLQQWLEARKMWC